MMKSDPVISEWQGAFAVLESNRRVSSSLLQEAVHTSRLIRWVVGLTVAMAMLTVLLATVGSIDPLQNWRPLDDAVHAGIYDPLGRDEGSGGSPVAARPSAGAVSEKLMRAWALVGHR